MIYFYLLFLSIKTNTFSDSVKKNSNNIFNFLKENYKIIIPSVFLFILILYNISSIVNKLYYVIINSIFLTAIMHCLSIINNSSSMMEILKDSSKEEDIKNIENRLYYIKIFSTIISVLYAIYLIKTFSIITLQIFLIFICFNLIIFFIGEKNFNNIKNQISKELEKEGIENKANKTKQIIQNQNILIRNFLQ